MPESPTPVHARGLKLLHLYRRGVGGERENAGRLLVAHLRAQDLTLYDLDPSLPVTQDVTALDCWRESAALLARLGTPGQDEALTALVDAGDLDHHEFVRVLEAVDLARLAGVRADGWAHALGVSAPELSAAAAQVTPGELLVLTGSLADRLQQVARQRHWEATHPERLIRVADPLTGHLVLGLVLGLTGQGGHLTPEGVRARLNVEQLARLRTLIAQQVPGLTQQALWHAQELGQQLAASLP